MLKVSGKKISYMLVSIDCTSGCCSEVIAERMKISDFYHKIMALQMKMLGMLKSIRFI